MSEFANMAKRGSILIVDDVSYISMIMERLKDQYRGSLANSEWRPSHGWQEILRISLKV